MTAYTCGNQIHEVAIGQDVGIHLCPRTTKENYTLTHKAINGQIRTSSHPLPCGTHGVLQASAICLNF